MHRKHIAYLATLLASALVAGNASALAISVKPSALPASLSFDLAPTVITDTASDLKVQWTWDLLGASSSLSPLSDPTLTHWSVNLASFTKSVSIPDIGSFALLAANVDAQHLDGAATGSALHYVWTQSDVGTFATSATQALSHAGSSDTFTFASARTGGNVTFTLSAVHAVPEPESYAMLLAGLGALGLAARRRRSRR